MDTELRRKLTIAIVGTVIVIAYAAWAAIHILIVNPLAAMPGYTAGEIHDAVTAAGQWSGPVGVYVTLSIGPALAIAALVVAIRLRSLSVTSTLAISLALIVLGAPGYFWASFDLGMGMADTFGITGGDYSPWAGPLYIVSLVALIALVAVGAFALFRRRRPAAAPAGAAASA